ncbi:Propanoyl-CoA C-acyltransferase [Nitrosotalea sinensis]|uniref:Propanoyl-CoA C-acyltransferase n=1 Tax=Nitrosotalea sinensis TaxID=1499975 RepID=A0A2H1EHV2_9ARCH|nr:thiolase family protein [Candidatus Nitrosotalea sinensis]SHO46666.1 Propanoyl-CoA C-acyltransferase [Candidatus Nitrosotalea sinensis]
MRKVAIVATGITKFDKSERPLDMIMLSAVKKMFESGKNLEQHDIDAVLASTNANRNYIANIISELSGIKPKISHSVESLCNSGTNSLVSAYAYVSSGLADVVLVVGADKANNPGLVLNWDMSRGEYTHPIFWSSMFTSAHMRKYGTSLEDLAYVSVKNHDNALSNPDAFFDKSFSFDDVMKSKNLTENVRLLDCSMPCDGAAAILVCSEEKARKITDTPVWISGIGQQTTSASFTKNNDLSSMESTRHAVTQAYNMSGKTADDVDVVELHDAFSICEIIGLEEMGFCKKGEGSKLVRSLYDTCDKKINPRGGLLGAGHPLGATGIAQVVEVCRQLGGSAGKRQVPAAKTGLVHNMSAGATSSTVLVLES